MSLQTQTHTITLASTRFTTATDRRVLQYIRERNVVAAGERLFVAVSGGPDSTALFLILSRLAPKLRLDMTVTHFNHQLRTETEADADLDYVRALASALRLPLTHSSGDVRTYARDHHLSIEDAARRVRYAFLSEQATSFDAPAVSLGHTLDDQAETVLLHLIRGTGHPGAGGMAPRARWPLGEGPDLVRPLLFLRRADTERYCRESGLTPRTDPTNDLPIATRNRVRHEVLPALRRLNPRIDAALARFADAAEADAAYLDDLAGSTFEQLSSSTDSAVSLDRAYLHRQPRPIAARVIRVAFTQLHQADTDLEATHIEALLDGLDGPPGSHSFPGRITVTIDQRSIILSKGSPPSQTPIPETPLTLLGRTIVSHWLIESQLVAPPGVPKTGNNEAYLDADKTGANLAVRSRHAGDRLRPLGLGGEKKLQDILVDAKVPARDRDAIPLVCAGDQIAWVVGHCIDERFALNLSSSRAVHLIATKTQANS